MARFTVVYLVDSDMYDFKTDSNKELFEKFRSECIIVYPNNNIQNIYKHLCDFEFDEDFDTGRIIVYKITENEIEECFHFELIKELKQGVLELQSSQISTKREFDWLVYENNIWYPLPDLYKYFDLKNVEEMIKNEVLDKEAVKYVIDNNLCNVEFKTKNIPEPNEIV